MTGKRNRPSSPVGSPSSGNISDSSSKEQDRFLPIANVSRIMKKSLPTNAKISKEAKETVQECVSEFISFITGEASDKCQREKRKTINGDDLLWAMVTLGFENYVGPLKVYLNRYRETEEEKNSMVRQEDNHHQQSPTSYGANEFNNVNAGDHFQGYNGGFFSLGTQVNRKQSYGDHGGRGIGYGENLMAAAGGFNTSSIGENDDGNGNRTMAAADFHKDDW
ncbi:Nuclear transcription factor Y subunit B-1 [Hibiscus syriacus]|uniref:Nuclear transcription factor Y subunit B-1 n=1 Tax=Hibiscus syriacus TaxID=106335 RepID=A0A6A3AVM4_HIBSY|nr:nuclear transcription factor Y subunit B-8-like [Hibiscus syriacus]KAE8706932.1 Nuclear transcription factor Y subunit B-1 [Hibiscus syriacus]